MRPRQWSKNAFVLGGLIFSGSALHVQPELRAWTTFVAFCLMSGATYLLNDAVDAEADRLNPRTAGRPIARGCWRGALAPDTLPLRGATDRDLLDAAAGLKIQATGSALDLDEAGRRRATQLAERVRMVAASQSTE